LKVNLSNRSLNKQPEIYTIPSIDDNYEPSSDEDIKAAEDWNVKQVQTCRQKSRHRLTLGVKYKTSDQTKILVDLYESEEGFLEEYENFLSETILLDRNFIKERELTGIEFLKQHFGEFKLLRCDVFFKDIQNSERYCKNYRSELTHEEISEHQHLGLSLKNLHMLIVSSGYWPINNKSHFQYTKPFEKIANKFLTDFQKKKNKIQTIEFHNNLGSVTVLNYVKPSFV